MSTHGHRLLLIDDGERLGPLLASYFQRFVLALETAIDPVEEPERLARGGIELVILEWTCRSSESTRPLEHEAYAKNSLPALFPTSCNAVRRRAVRALVVVAALSQQESLIGFQNASESMICQVHEAVDCRF